MSDFFNSNENKDSYWISISDLMSVLMMIFLFIAISYMVDVVKEKDKIKNIAVTYSKLQTELYNDLFNEFEYDLKNWNAKLDKESLSIKFNAPDVLFSTGSSKLKTKFKRILDDFFPRFIKILTRHKYFDDISEIRIEGHTSSEWQRNVGKDEGYFYNMQLSQNRTREVLKYIFFKRNLKNKEWLRKRITANGLSSSRTITVNNIEDKIKSRRVEFKVKINVEKRMVNILKTN